MWLKWHAKKKGRKTMKEKEKRPERQEPKQGANCITQTGYHKDSKNLNTNKISPNINQWRSYAGDKIFRQIRYHGAMSLQTLERRTKINQTTIRTSLEGMIRDGYIKKIGKRHNNKGKGSLAMHYEATGKSYRKKITFPSFAVRDKEVYQILSNGKGTVKIICDRLNNNYSCSNVRDSINKLIKYKLVMGWGKDICEKTGYKACYYKVIRNREFSKYYRYGK